MLAWATCAWSPRQELEDPTVGTNPPSTLPSQGRSFEDSPRVQLAWVTPPLTLRASLLLSAAVGVNRGAVQISAAAGMLCGDLGKDGRLQFADRPLTPSGPGMYRAESADLVLALLRRNIVFTNSHAVFRRSIWKRVGGFD